jgi:predicted transposase YdaD
MTPEKRMAYEMTLSANALAVENENRKIREAEERREQKIKTETVTKAIKRGKLTIEEIAEDSGVSVDFVLEIQQGLVKNQ